MTQTERRLFLINELLHERQECQDMDIPAHAQGQKNLLRSLFNIRMPQPINEEFLKVQDEYLQAEAEGKGIINITFTFRVDGKISGDSTNKPCQGLLCNIEYNEKRKK